MKISRLVIKGYRQFRDLKLDLVDRAGQPLRRVCFIGPNGTGKTTLLRVLMQLLPSLPGARIHPKGAGSIRMAKIETERGPSLSVHDDKNRFTFRSEFETDANLERFSNTRDNFSTYFEPNEPLLEAGMDLVISMSADGAGRLVNDPPSMPLNQALSLERAYPLHHQISLETAEAFWLVMTHQIKRRDGEYRAFLELAENQPRQVAEVREEFNRKHPEMLPALAELWNRILERPGLYFDLSSVTVPIQLNESLALHIKLRETNQPLPFNDLSSGIRSYLFRLGHLKSLYFERNVRHSFLFVDEPENSLYPDILYDLVDTYTEIAQGAQMFFATHSPIVAAQFKPEERVLLEFDEHGAVTSQRGVSPEGDDPNDVLRQDFHVQSVYGPAGLAQWRRFIELQRLIRAEQNVNLKARLIEEYSRIGHAYNFDITDRPE